MQGVFFGKNGRFRKNPKLWLTIGQPSNPYLFIYFLGATHPPTFSPLAQHVTRWPSLVRLTLPRHLSLPVTTSPFVRAWQILQVVICTVNCKIGSFSLQISWYR
jgi:hypothetical protein